MVAWRQSPEALAAATAAARALHEAIVSLTRVAGFEFAADFLSDWATGIRQSKGRVRRRKTALVPTIAGRHPRDEAEDFYWKCQLLARPVDPSGKPLTITDLARLKVVKARCKALSGDTAPNPERLAAITADPSFKQAVEAARRHLTRLHSEAKAETAAGRTFEPLTEDDQPNALLRTAGVRARRSET